MNYPTKVPTIYFLALECGESPGGSGNPVIELPRRILSLNDTTGEIINKNNHFMTHLFRVGGQQGLRIGGPASQGI
jgi:hypothetical protein